MFDRPPQAEAPAPQAPKPPAMRPILWALVLAFVCSMAFFYMAALSDPTPPPPSPLPQPVETEVHPTAKTTPPSAQPKTSRPRPRPVQKVAPSAAVPKADLEDQETQEEAEPEEQRFVIVEGTVTDEEGEPQVGTRVVVQINGRKRYYTTNVDGVFGARQLAGELQVWAQRQDGALTTTSERIAIDGSEGGSWEVELVLPASKKAGLGVRIRRTADGIAIRSVIPGTPAAELGLEPGDLITYIGNETTEDMSISSFIERMTGEEESSQTFTVLRDDGTEEDLTLVRKAIPSGGRKRSPVKRPSRRQSSDEEAEEEED